MFSRDELNVVLINNCGDYSLQLVLWSFHLFGHNNELWHFFYAAAEEYVVTLTLHGVVVDDFIECDECRVFV